MAQIPLGNFEMARAVPRADTTRVDTSPLNIAGSGAAAVGRGLLDVGDAAARGMAQHRQEAEAVARAKAANAAQAFDLEVQSAVADEADNLRRGGDYNTAPDRISERLSKLEAPQVDGLPPDALAAYSGHVENLRKAGRLSIDNAVVAARRDDGQRQFATMLDLGGKAAGMPGADVDQVNARLREQSKVYATTFGLDQSTVETAVQNRIDANWSNHAGQRFNAGSGDLGAMEGMLHDLTAKDGFYVDKLDPDKRVAMTAAVNTQIDRIKTSARVEADKREKIAEGVVKDAVEQAVSGLPPTPDTLASWAVAVKGTTHEEAFKGAVQQIAEVQQIRRMPGPQQQAWLADKEQQLNAGGGSPQDLQRLQTVRAALARDAEERAKNPLQYLENMTGKPAAPLNLQGMATGDVASIGTTLADRMASLKALQAQGFDVALKPLKAEEAEQLSTVMAALPPDKALGVFAPLRAATGADDVYAAVMDQIAPNAPLKAYAGTLAVRPGGRKAAELVLRGDALLAGKDGKAWPMPAQSKFEQAFAEDAGNAYQGRADAYKRDLAAARAVYAASAAQDGDTNAGSEFDERRFSDAIRAVRGDVAEVNGSQVTVPWGMDPDTFVDQVHQPMREALKAAGLDPDASGIGLMATDKAGRYVLMQGRFPVWNPSVQREDKRLMPVFIDFAPPAPAPKHAAVSGAAALHVVAGLGQ
jgi:hypothetical protein